MISFFFRFLEHGLPSWLVDNAWLIFKVAVTIAAVTLVKIYSNGARNLSDKVMHGKVVMMTGGTAGIGARVALELAQKGAQLVLLTRSPPSDFFLVEFVQDLRRRSGNELIYAEQVDLASLHSIRQFATKWIDNAPPRRLDMIILCAAALTPPGNPYKETREGIEETWMVNFLANFHLLSILSPAIRAQQFDRDVRVLVATCSSYIRATPIRGGEPTSSKEWSPAAAYARSKLALMMFGKAFQKHLDSYKRPDELPMNARVVFVDPGYSRTPGMRRWLTRGTLWGLAVYMLAYPITWLLLKSPDRGAQSFLYAAMESDLGRGPGGKMVKECIEIDFARTDLEEEESAKRLWQDSDALIERVEKEQAVKRNREKKQAEEKARQEEEARKAQEIHGLVDAIKKGKAKEGETRAGKSKRTGGAKK